MKKGKKIIICVVIAFIITVTFLLRQLYINSKMYKIDVVYEGVIIYNAENGNKSDEEKKVSISIKGTLDERYVSSCANEFVEEADKVFEGTITIGNEVFKLGHGKENSLSVSQYENGVLQMLCSNNQVGGEQWFFIYVDDFNFERIVLQGMKEPIEHRYSNCYIVAPVDNEENAIKEYNDMMKKINK